MALEKPWPGEMGASPTGASSLVYEAFERGAHVVTLVGPPGVGKTWSATQFVQSSGADALMCDSAMAHTREDVVSLVGRAIEVLLLDAEREPLEALGAALARMQDVVLVLDDADRCVGPLAAAVSEWQRLAPRTRFLVTSRERLHVRGEVVIEVPTLSTDEAMALFVRRACAIRPEFRPGAADEMVMVALVERLDRLPLAIELAAARVGVLSPTEILARLSARFELLSVAPRDAPPRQRTLHAALESSWELLSPDERFALTRASMCRGGFSLEAASALLTREGALLDVLQALRDKSLLRQVGDQGSSTRFSMYECVRDFAAEQLRDEATAEDAQARHAAFYLSLGTRLATTWARTGDPATLRALTSESENLVSAHDWAVSQLAQWPTAQNADRALQLLYVLSSLDLVHGPAVAYRSRCEATFAAGAAELGLAALEAAVLWKRGYMHQLLGRLDASRADLGRALTLARRANDATLEVQVLRILGTTERQAGQHGDARAHLEAAVERGRRLADPSVLAMALLNLAQLRHVQGHLDEARELLLETLRVEHACDARPSLGLLEHTLGCVLHDLGDLAAARARHESAVQIARNREHRHYLGWFLGALAQVEHESGRPQDARPIYEEALAIATSIGDEAARSYILGPLSSAIAACGDLEAAREMLDLAEASAASSGGAASMTVVELHRGCLEVARAQAIVTRTPGGDGAPEAALRDQAASRLVGASDSESDEVRFARRLLRAALERAPRSSPPTDGNLAALPVLSVAADAGCFILPDGARVSLSTKPRLRRVLLTLVRARVATPGEAISLEQIVRGGWPKERMSETAANNRVHVALSRLRKLGLQDVLCSTPTGHLLSPSVVLRVMGDE